MANDIEDHSPQETKGNLQSSNSHLEYGPSTSSPLWEYADEKEALRKVDFTVLPLLTLGLFVFQLDRMNLASALTGGFKEHIGVDQNTINIGNQLMFAGIVLLEIPSNMLLQKVGPRKYMSAQVFIFGLTATLQIFVKDRTGFLVSRSFLGLAEAGYIPGAIYVLSTWYTESELARRIAIFFFGMFGGNAFSPLLASGILQLDGMRGIPGWKWIFLLEGLATVVVSLLMLLFLPGSPQNPRPLFINGIFQITPRDAHLLQTRLSTTKETNVTLTITPKKVWKTITNWQRWPHFVCTAAVFSTWAPLTTYTPTIITSLGFNRTEANALSSIGGIVSLFVVFAFAYLSDRTQRRSAVVGLAITCYLVTLVLLKTINPHVGRWGKYALWAVVNAFAVGYHPVHNTWVQVNCSDPQERSVAIAMWVMSAISGLMAGSQIFRQEDTPFYSTGLLIMIGLVGFGLVMWVVQVLTYIFQNKSIEMESGDSVYLEKGEAAEKRRKYVL